MYPTHAEFQRFQAQHQQELQKLVQQWNAFAGGLRTEHKRFAEKGSQQLADLANIAQALRMSGPGSKSDCITWETKGVVRVEDIPGRRVPYEVVVSIPIASASTSDVEGTYVVTQEGPFVAVRRWATFLSNLSYQVVLNDGTPVGRFLGRTFGRYRPVHSAWDLFDAQQMPVTTVNPTPTGATSAVMGVISSMSGGRSMSFDGRILMFNAGSSYPRMNEALPSSIWTTQINSPFDLGALDFFERGETITFKVTPNHPSNPSFGNADGPDIFASAGALAAAGYPFLAGQFDAQEGIVTPGGFTVANNVVTRLANDGVTRLPDGVLIVGLSGYRIIQPVGPVL